MSDESLAELAKLAGIAVDWTDAFGQPQQVSPDNLRQVLESLGFAASDDTQVNHSLERLRAQGGAGFLPPLLTAQQGQAVALGKYFSGPIPYELQLENGEYFEGRLDEQAQLTRNLPFGYHRLMINNQLVTLAVAPASAPRVASLTGKERVWGLGAQLYALRRPGDGGLGDLAACAQLAQQAAAAGADALAISPMHAMFAADGYRYSPYSPSSRLFFNLLHCAPENLLGQPAVEQAINATGLGPELQRLESLELIDYPAVSQAKLQLLRALFEAFAASPKGPLHQKFKEFRHRGGQPLDNHCIFEALHGLHVQQSQIYDWHQWPAHYQDPNNPEVREFARQHQHEVAFHAFCQWLVSHDLDQAQQAARNAGMGIGLIADLAVGADGAGSQAWSSQQQILGNLTVGAPPDALARAGQSWGVCGFSPTGLIRHGFSAFIDMLRANLAHVGGLRIDHIMGLYRLWVIPQGAPSVAGAYLHYPFEDLLRLVTLEAARHNALILGEDLGTVPGDFRAQLIARNLLGIRVLLFEQDSYSHVFRSPEQWDSQALATTTTHDLPTLTGWWQGNDIEWRSRVGQTDEPRRQAEHEQRGRERQGLANILHHQGLLSDGMQSTPEALLDAAASFIGRTPCSLALLPMEDALGLAEQPNLPGDIDKHPNWRRRLPQSCDQLLASDSTRQRLACLDAARKGA